MAQITRTSKLTSICIFFFLFIPLYVFLSSVDRITTSSSGYYAAVLPLLLALVPAVSVIFAVRTTILTWITLMVLLAFFGKRRRVLVREGSMIMSDVAMHSAQIVLKERCLLAFGCASIVSLVAIAWLRGANQSSM